MAWLRLDALLELDQRLREFDGFLARRPLADVDDLQSHAATSFQDVGDALDPLPQSRLPTPRRRQLIVVDEHLDGNLRHVLVRALLAAAPVRQTSLRCHPSRSC